jgi:hypothetical protein
VVSVAVEVVAELAAAAVAAAVLFAETDHEADEVGRPGVRDVQDGPHELDGPDGQDV